MTTSENSERPPSRPEKSVKAVSDECLPIYRQSVAEPLRDRLPELLEMAKANPNKKNFRAFITDVAIDLGRYAEGIELLNQSIQLDGPNDIRSNILAFCRWELGRQDLAYQSYVESLRLNPDNRSSLRGACYLAIEGGHCDEALDYCGRFHATAPTGVEETLWFALALHDSGKPEHLVRAERLISESDPALNLREEFDRRE